MELIKKNIHMDHMKCKATTQVTLEEDVNISDSKPDVSKIIFEKGDIKIDDMKVQKDSVCLRGKLLFCFLYTSNEGEKNVYSMEGSIPLEEVVNMEGVEPGDDVTINWNMEDLNINMINSRKISVQALITFMLYANKLYDMEIPVDISCQESLEYQRKPINMWEIAIQKKDIFRLKQEIDLPKNLPNINEMIWQKVQPMWMDFRAMDDKIGVNGEANVFFMYEGEGEDSPIRFYETMIPITGSIDCFGANGDMIPILSFKPSHQELEVRPDFDGEQRVLGLDLVFDLDMKLYVEVNTEMICDVYGVTKEVDSITQKGDFKSLLVRNNGKQKVNDKMKVNADHGRIMQLVHSQADGIIDQVSIIDNGLEVKGTVAIKILYVTNNDEVPFHSMKGNIPFSYVIDAPGINHQCTYTVIPGVEQIMVAMIDSEEVDVKVVLGFATTVFCNQKQDVMKDITVNELNLDTINELPSIAIYIVKDGDSLWQIGKKYYVPVDSIKETNGLTGNHIETGDKLLIVKEFS